MAHVALFKSGATPQYLTSVNTPDYESDTDALINPDISEVRSVPLKFWKRSGSVISEMSAAEKQSITDTELTERKVAADTFSTGSVAIFTALIKVINQRLPAGQKITKQELIDAIKQEVN